MLSRTTTRSALSAVAVLLFAGAAVAAEPACPRTGAPDAAWEARSPAAAGWSAAGLEATWAAARKANFTSGMLVQDGRVLGAFGDVTRPNETRSMRKSFINALIGQLVAEDRLSLDATLGDLGIDDRTPLSAQEKSARVRDLLASRSGVNLVGAYSLPSQIAAIGPRDADRPGERFAYLNWGFNVLGVIAEKAGGADVFTLFDRRIAKPLGMQDFDPARDGQYRREPVSDHPAYLLDLSTRDRARFGLLYLDEGCWAGRRLLSRDWVRSSLAPVTVGADPRLGLDYGWLWWSAPPPAGTGLTRRIFMARGFASQFIVGIPELDALLVLTVDMSDGEAKLKAGLRPPSPKDFDAALRGVLAARPAAVRQAP